MLRKQDQVRVPAPEERAVLHGIPPSILDPVSKHAGGDKAVAAANSAIGNGFHLPSVICILQKAFARNRPKTYTVTKNPE